MPRYLDNRYERYYVYQYNVLYSAPRHVFGSWLFHAAKGEEWNLESRGFKKFAGIHNWRSSGALHVPVKYFGRVLVMPCDYEKDDFKMRLEELRANKDLTP